MKENVKRVFYVRYVAHPCYFEIIAQRPEIRLDKLENETADNAAAPILAAAHAYQIGSPSRELKPPLHSPGGIPGGRAHPPLRSHNGAGFDTRHIKDFTPAGG